MNKSDLDQTDRGKTRETDPLRIQNHASRLSRQDLEASDHAKAFPAG